MKRRNLCNTKKLLAVILAASMAMSSGIVTLAEEPTTIEVRDGQDKDKNSAYSGKDDSSTVVYVESDGQEKPDITINEDVYTTKDYDEKEVTGVHASASGSGAETNVSVGKDVDVATGSNGSTDNTSFGVEASSDNSGKTNVEVGHDVSIEAHNNAEGVSASSYNNSTTTVSVGHEVYVKSDTDAIGIDAKAEKGGTTEVSVGTSESSEGGVFVDSNGNSDRGIANVTGVKVTSTNSSSNVVVDVEKKIDVTSRGSGIASGIVINPDVDIESGSLTIKTGTVSVNSENGMAKGIDANNISDGRSANVNVNGDIIATSKNGVAEGIVTEGVNGNLTISITGSVIQSGNGEFAVGLVDSSETTNLAITVGTDVKANNNDAVSVIKNEKDSKLSLEVDGTISGKDHNIVLMGESTTENLDITVWKVDTSNDKHVVDTYDYNNGYSKVDVGDSIVNYIIKADSTEAKIAMSGQGEQRSDGTYVAKQGKEVYFSVDIPDGYTAEFYDVNDNTAYQIIPNGTGGAYISVPRGGGVYVGVRLTKTSTAESNSDSTKESSSANTVTIVNSESRSESGASDGEYWSPSSNNQANALSGVFSGYETLQALQIPSAIYGGSDMFVNVADVLTPVDTITAMNSFTGTDRASINTNNVMGAGIVDFKNMFVNASSNTVEVPVPANVIANQSYTVMFSDGTSMVVPCAMNGVLSIPFSKTAEGLTYIICGIQLDPSMFIGMPPATGWTY